MTERFVQRRLTAIMAAVVVGCSRLMGSDEARTLGELKAHRKDLIDKELAKHQGRVVKLMGDWILAEFASAVNAVACAVGVQAGIRLGNADTPKESRIQFRIGINVGDIIVEDDDIYGDGVNVAARLESFARPRFCIVARRSEIRGS